MTRSLPPARSLLLRVARPIFAIGLVVTALGSSVGAAGAATSWHVDAARDVATYVIETDSYQPVPSSWGDIDGLSVSYDENSLRIATSLKAYERLEGYWFTKFRTSQGFDYVAGTSLSTKTGPTLQRKKVGSKGAFHAVPCESLTVSRTDRGISMRIPTACIESAWRVKVGVGTEVYGPSGTDKVHYTDDALSDGHITRDTDPSKLTLGPWVDQG